MIWILPEGGAKNATPWTPGVVRLLTYDVEVVVPFVVEPELDAAIEAALRRARAARKAKPGATRRWAKSEHLERMAAGGVFSQTREIVLHGESAGGARRLLGAVGSIGPVLEMDSDLAHIRAVAERVLGDRVVPWLVSYRVRVGIR